MENTDPYEVKWYIGTVGIPAPEMDENKHVYYTGKEIYLKDHASEILKGFDPAIMEIVEEGEYFGINAGEYTATIKIKGGNYFWKDSESDTITIKWKIDKTSVDLSGVKWVYSWAENGSWTPEDGYPVYTRVNGKPVIYKAYLEGLPDAIKAHVQYTTNNSVGAFAGINAGKYTTRFDLVNLGENFEEIKMPEGLENEIVWYIEKRVLEMPATNIPMLVFDDDIHDLLEMLGLERDGDWINYCTINVQYASHNVYGDYEGFNGDPFLAYGAGRYMIQINVITGINTSAKNPNVVWRTPDTDNPPANGDNSGGGAENNEGAEEQFIAHSSLSTEYSLKTKVYGAPYRPEFYAETTNDSETGDSSGEGEEGGEEGEEEDDIIIADPDEDDREDEGDYDFDIPDIGIGIEKLVLTVTGWTGSNTSAWITLKEGSQYLYFLERGYYDSEGNKVTLEEIQADNKHGHTYFIHVEVKQEYLQNIELKYEDGVKKSYDFSTIFESGTTLKPIAKPEISINPKPYTGEEVDIEAEIAEILKEYEGILKVVVTESDGYKQTEVGTYVITICFEDGSEYCWEPAGSGDRSSIVITWTIGKAVIKGEWTELGRLELESEYTGSYEGIIEYKYTDKETGKEVTVNELEVGKTYIAEVILLDSERFELIAEKTHEFSLGTELIFEKRPELMQTEFGYTGQDIIAIINGWTEKYEGNVEIISGSLTAKEVGKYTVVLKITNAAFAWDDNLTENVTLTYEIKKAQLSGTWNVEKCELNLSSSYLGSYESVVRYEIRDASGKIVSKDEMQKGQVYTIYAILVDEEHFEWTEEMKLKLSVTFTYDNDLERLPLPKFENAEISYTGQQITFVIQEWESKYSLYLEKTNGKLSQTSAGEYTITLKFKNGLATWEDGSTTEITLKFVIKKAVLTGEWGNDGKVRFESSYTGNYNDVVEYVYTDMSGNPVRASQLKEGERYKVLVRLKDTVNFEFAAGFNQEYEFTYEKSGSFAWWLILIIILAIILLIIIIIIIVIVIRRRISARNRAEEDESVNNSYGSGTTEGAEDDYSDIYGDGGYESGADEDYSDIYGETDANGTAGDDYSDIYGANDDSNGY